MVKRNRVVITGMGVLAPNGIGLDAFWESVLHCRSGIGPITLLDASRFKTQIAGEIKDFDPADYIEPELKPKRMARHTQLAYAATMMALKDAGLEINNLSLPSPTPVVIGVSTSAIDVIESVHFAVERGTPNRAPVSSAAASIPQAAGIFVLENWERALARGARAYVEIEGYGKQRDTDREKPASGLFDSMRLALANAGRSIDDVDYISAYGPGDPTLDAAEVAVIK